MQRSSSWAMSKSFIIVIKSWRHLGEQFIEAASDVPHIFRSRFPLHFAFKCDFFEKLFQFIFHLRFCAPHSCCSASSWLCFFEVWKCTKRLSLLIFFVYARYFISVSKNCLGICCNPCVVLYSPFERSACQADIYCHPNVIFSYSFLLPNSRLTKILHLSVRSKVLPRGDESFPS